MVEQQVDASLLDVVFGALADSTRRAMLRRLAQREHTVSELAGPFAMTLAGASKHVKALERAGLVERTIVGRRHVCRLAPEPLSRAEEWLRFYERFWNERFDALETVLRDTADLTPDGETSKKEERHD
jgi:DNA-binding transcriptional ArsR family regulator